MPWNCIYIADGCDSSNNNAECGFDGGDCCPGDCTDATYMEQYGGTCDDCVNPDTLIMLRVANVMIIATCADTDCGSFIALGYDCDELASYGYVVLVEEDACPVVGHQLVKLLVVTNHG